MPVFALVPAYRRSQGIQRLLNPASHRKPGGHLHRSAASLLFEGTSWIVGDALRPNPRHWMGMAFGSRGPPGNSSFSSRIARRLGYSLRQPAPARRSSPATAADGDASLVIAHPRRVLRCCWCRNRRHAIGERADHAERAALFDGCGMGGCARPNSIATCSWCRKRSVLLEHDFFDYLRAPDIERAVLIEKADPRRITSRSPLCSSNRKGQVAAARLSQGETPFAG